MATLAPGTSLRVSETDDGWNLATDGDSRGRIRGSEVEFDDLTLHLRHTGQRFELVTAIGTPVLRFDPAGRKATTLTTSSARFRLARQRPRPLLHRWHVTRDVHGDALLRVSHSPLGVRVTAVDEPDADPAELAILAIGALVEVLDLEPAAAVA